MKDRCKFRLIDKIIFFIARFISFIYTRLFLGFRCKDKYKKAKNETCIVLSNHQTDFDPFCLAQSFNFAYSCVATDNIFINKFVTKVLKNIFHTIPKKKGTIDLSTIMNMYRTIDVGGNILLFPEGNRSFAEFQFYIAPDFPKILKRLKSTIILYNLHGGTGIRPRFSSSLRKGKFYGEIKRVLKYEEYANLDDEELLNLVKSELKVYDSFSNEKYKSKTRAEYLERMFFVCPVCNSICNMHSEKEFLKCNSCNTKVEYTEDLKFKSDNQEFKFVRLIDYWNYQKKYIKNLIIEKGKTIFSDNNIRLFLADPYKKRELLYEGNMEITDKGFIFGDEVHNIEDIVSGSVIQSQKLVYNYKGHDYLIKGDNRFNPLKYMFLFSKLNEKFRNKEKYYNLEEDIC